MFLGQNKLHWPKQIVEYVIQKAWTLICGFNSLHSSATGAFIRSNTMLGDDSQLAFILKGVGWSRVCRTVNMKLGKHFFMMHGGIIKLRDQKCTYMWRGKD